MNDTFNDSVGHLADRHRKARTSYVRRKTSTDRWFQRNFCDIQGQHAVWKDQWTILAATSTTSMCPILCLQLIVCSQETIKAFVISAFSFIAHTILLMPIGRSRTVYSLHTAEVARSFTTKNCSLRSERCAAATANACKCFYAVIKRVTAYQMFVMKPGREQEAIRSIYWLKEL